MKKIFQNKILSSILILSLGWMACDKNEDNTDLSVSAVTPVEGSGGDVIGISGAGFTNIASITFDNQDVPASINPAFVSDNRLLVRVPDTAFGGLQNIIVTSKDGKTAQIPFTVIALPNIASVDKRDFAEDIVLNFTGNNFDDVTSVKLSATNQEAEILSQSRKTISVKMPASSAAYTKLIFTNVSGERETEFELSNIDHPDHLKLFDDVLYYDNWSWGGDGNWVPVSTPVLMGEKSLRMPMSDAWVGLQLPLNPEVDINNYRYVSFYIYGHTKDVNLLVKFNWADFQTVTVIANRWNYFKLPLQPYSVGKGPMNSFVIQNADAGLFYLDNLVFLK